MLPQSQFLETGKSNHTREILMDAGLRVPRVAIRILGKTPQAQFDCRRKEMP